MLGFKLPPQEGQPVESGASAGSKALCLCPNWVPGGGGQVWGIA